MITISWEEWCRRIAVVTTQIVMPYCKKNKISISAIDPKITRDLTMLINWGDA